MPPVDELLDRDAAIILHPHTRALRERVTPFVTMYRPQVTASLTSDRAPSYVVDAMIAMLAAFDRWQRDEEALIEKVSHA